MKVYVSVVLSAFLVKLSASYHVLFYHNVGTKSHLIQFSPLVEELLGRGHEVTSVFLHSLNLKHENYTEIVVPDVMASMDINKVFQERGGIVGQMMARYDLMTTYADQLTEEMAMMPFKVKGSNSIHSPEIVAKIFQSTVKEAHFFEYREHPHSVAVFQGY